MASVEIILHLLSGDGLPAVGWKHDKERACTFWSLLGGLFCGSWEACLYVGRLLRVFFCGSQEADTCIQWCFYRRMPLREIEKAAVTSLMGPT